MNVPAGITSTRQPLNAPQEHLQRLASVSLTTEPTTLAQRAATAIFQLPTERSVCQESPIARNTLPRPKPIHF